MTPLLLKLVNFTGILDRLNRDEIEIDFSKLPRGLIALVGPNGQGKTTIIDNMHPYRIMPSRAKKYSPSSFSFFDHIEPGKAIKTFIWQHQNGTVYKSELILHSKSRKSECFLFEKKNESWVVYTSPDGTIVCDGKTEPYDSAIEQLLGAPELFFTSQFLSQNRKSLSSYDNGDMKLLLSEMLNIENMKKLSRQAAEVCTILSNDLERRKGQIARFGDLKIQRDKMSVVIQETGREIDELKNSKIQTEYQYHEALSQLQNYEKLMHAGQEKLQQVERLNATLKQLIEAQQTRKRQHLDSVQKKSQSIHQLNAQIKASQSTLLMKEEVEQASAKLKAIASDLEKAQSTVLNLNEQLQSMNERKQKIIRIEHKMSDCENNGVNHASKLESLRKQSALIHEVPCESEAQFHANCPLLSNAHKANAECVGVEEIYLQTRQQYKAVRAELAEAKLTFKDPSELLQTVAMANKQLDFLRAENLRLTNLAAKSELIATAERSLQESKSLLVQLEDQLTQSELIYKKEEAQSLQSIEQISVELQQLKTEDQSVAIASTRQTIARLKESITSMEGKIEGLVKNLSRQTAEKAYIEQQLTNERQLQQCVDQLSAEIAFWKQLSLGLGNNGTIALCIDDAGPTLSALVNDLLICYGSEYTIEIQTQVEQLNGAVKEGFEIVVHDSLTMKTKKLEYMSGGQKLWINDCLCRGMALYLRLNEDKVCATLFSDETDGALDLEHRRQFMQMKRKVLELSGCEREYFISHSPECIDYADAIIDLSQYA